MNHSVRDKIIEAFSKAPPSEIIDMVKARRIKTEALHMLGTATQLFSKTAAAQGLLANGTVAVEAEKCSFVFGTSEGRRKAVQLVIGVDDQGPTYRVNGKKSVTTRTQETAFAALTTELVDHLKQPV